MKTESGGSAAEPESCAEAVERLATAAAGLGVALSARQCSQFTLYCDLLIQANARFNLTAVRTPAGIMSTLFLDSLTILATLPGWMKDRPISLVDVGAGAGIPGLPLKIAHPDWILTLVESVRKKARFLLDTICALGLEGAAVLAERAEVVGREQPWRDGAELCVARAVAPLPSLLELCGPLVRPGGYLALPKSGDVESEVMAARPAARALRLSLSRVDHVSEQLGLGAGRLVLLYEKVAPTPGGYPRRVGLARSRPIGSA